MDGTDNSRVVRWPESNSTGQTTPMGGGVILAPILICSCDSPPGDCKRSRFERHLEALETPDYLVHLGSDR